MGILKKILNLLTTREQKHAGLLLIMIIIMAFIDMMGVASIFPFMAVITNTSLIETNYLLKNLFQISGALGIKTIDEFIFFLGVLLFFILIFSLSFKAITIYAQMRFIQMRGHSIGKKLLETYLHQPYSWFLNHNSADLSKNILSEVTIITNQALLPIFNLITHSFISLFLIFLLFFIDIKLTLIITFVIGSLYFVIFSFSKKILQRIGKERLAANELRFKLINEVFGASKEVKFGRIEKIFIDKFSKPSEVVAKSMASSGILSSLPRYFIEAISFGGLLLIVLFIISKEGDFVNSIPIISIYAFAGYRLMPSLQQIYEAASKLKFSNSSINKTYTDLTRLKVNSFIENENTLSFNEEIKLNEINYNYPNSKKTTLRNISLTIPAKTKIGFIGPTGSGKSTIIDIILGLLEPQKGTLEIDGEVIKNNNKRSWQRNIGYVPQQIYLSDDTIAANIAFGIVSKNVDHNMVKKVSKIANLHEFIFNELPDQYNTIVGERGIRLSGGQRQRIGIARALYNNPKVLILDEATSALDNETEKAVMEAVNNISKDLTIILIAHRLNTLKNCDIIFMLDKGQLKNKGTYNDLISNNNH